MALQFLWFELHKLSYLPSTVTRSTHALIKLILSVSAGANAAAAQLFSQCIVMLF